MLLMSKIDIPIFLNEKFSRGNFAEVTCLEAVRCLMPGGEFDDEAG